MIYTECYECDEIKVGETGEACNTHGEAKVHTAVKCACVNVKGFVGEDG